MSERQVMPVSQRDWFERYFRQVGPGLAAQLDGLRHPLRVLEVIRQDPLAPVPIVRRVDDGHVGRRVDAFA